jgi:hypothetical protein
MTFRGCCLLPNSGHAQSKASYTLKTETANPAKCMYPFMKRHGDLFHETLSLHQHSCKISNLALHLIAEDVTSIHEAENVIVRLRIGQKGNFHVVVKRMSCISGWNVISSRDSNHSAEVTTTSLPHYPYIKPYFLSLEKPGIKLRAAGTGFKLECFSYRENLKGLPTIHK